MKKLAIITSHPIQYNAPLFKKLSEQPDLCIKVYYTLGEAAHSFIDKGFGKMIAWDIPLLQGYDYEFVKNISQNPGTSSIKGIVNPDLIERIERFGPSHVLVYGWSFISHLKVMRYFHKKAIILFRGDSTLLDERMGIKTFLRRSFLHCVYRYVDIAFYVGYNNKVYFLKHGLSEHQLKFAPHAVDNVRFGDDLIYKEQSNYLRQELNIDQDDIVFLFTGKFEKKKAPLLLVKAFKELNLSKAILLLVGNGVLEAQLHDEAKGYPNIKFLPFQNQSVMPAVYRTGDVLVLPSQGPGETWGLCLNEAMACGLPIIASDKVGGAIDLINEGENGKIFEAGNLNDLKNIFLSFASKDKRALKQMGEASKKLISRWNYDEVIHSLRTVILD